MEKLVTERLPGVDMRTGVFSRDFLGSLSRVTSENLRDRQEQKHMGTERHGNRDSVVSFVLRTRWRSGRSSRTCDTTDRTLMWRVDRTEGLNPAVSLWDAPLTRGGLESNARLWGETRDLFTFTQSDRQRHKR